MAGPPTLLQNSVYRLPPSLVLAFRDELRSRGLLERARQGTDAHDVYGGESTAASLDHFAYRFQTSATRPQHLLLSSSSECTAIRGDLLSTLSSHHVAVLDIACGTGAGSLSLLMVMLELRRANLHPTLPLHVTLLGADFSATARDVFSSMCRRVAPELAKAAITLTWNTAHWDGRRSETTAAICDQWLTSEQRVNEYLVIVNNFGGDGRAIQEDLEWSWKHVGDRVYNAASYATWLWTENDGNSGQKFLKAISSFFDQQMSRIYQVIRRTPIEKYEWFDSITGRQVTSGMTAHEYKREP